MDTYLENILSKHTAVLIDFSASWCEPCTWALPVIKDVIKHFDGKLILEIIDIDLHSETAKSLHVLSVPTLVLFVNGIETWRMRGYDIAPKLIESIGKHLIVSTTNF